MDNILDQLTFNFEDSFSLVNYIVYILICAVLLYLLAMAYSKFGQSISNRSQLSKVLMMVGLTTFIIISIVKSSLALSLGLVGALSIVRFRTAIKEPEELGYFFIAIAIGLGMGANQLLPTIIGFLMLLLIIAIQYYTGSRSSITQSLLIQIKNTPEVNRIEEVTRIVTGLSQQIELKRMKESEDQLSFTYMIKVKSMESLSQINRELRTLDAAADITFLDNTL